MLSVFSTLKEMLFLWVRNFWYLVALTLITGTFAIFLECLDNYGQAQRSLLLPLLGMSVPLGGLLLDAVNAAAILGLLRRQSLGKTAGVAVWSSIETYTWTLFRLIFLIGIIAVPFIAAMVGVVLILKLGQIAFLIGFAFFLIFLKYALADPLVVVENLRARAALKRSWKMTKGHFWYVMGCYLFLGAGEWLINWLMALPLPDADAKTSWVGIPVEFGSKLIDSMWIILSWCMYLRIKETDAPLPTEAVLS